MAVVAVVMLLLLRCCFVFVVVVVVGDAVVLSCCGCGLFVCCVSKAAGVSHHSLRAQTCTFEFPGASKQNSTRRPPERHKKSETVAGKGRKSAKFWVPHPSGPLRGPTLRGPPRGRFGQSWPIKVGQDRFGQSRSNFSGQSRFGQKSELAKVGLSRRPEQNIQTIKGSLQAADVSAHAE